MAYKLTVADNVLQVAYQTEFEENDRVDALLAAIPIISLGQWVKKVQIQHLFQLPIKIVLRNTLAQLKIIEKLLLVIFLSLHT